MRDCTETLTPERRLYDALLRYLDTRGMCLDTTPTAELVIPTKNGGQLEIPILLLMV
jgi:hypothetical protein